MRRPRSLMSQTHSPLLRHDNPFKFSSGSFDTICINSIRAWVLAHFPATSCCRATLLLVLVVFLQEFGSELLWRRGNVWPALRRKVHEIPTEEIVAICRSG